MFKLLRFLVTFLPFILKIGLTSKILHGANRAQNNMYWEIHTKTIITIKLLCLYFFVAVICEINVLGNNVHIAPTHVRLGRKNRFTINNHLKNPYKCCIHLDWSIELVMYDISWCLIDLVYFSWYFDIFEENFHFY